ncbi:MAG: hypothetical protein D4R43_01780 [Sphingobacteriales bacterium]|nr:MAG: hypothetical protein D4R43_01780 [Sphingobacteriales bacterium]
MKKVKNYLIENYFQIACLFALSVLFIVIAIGLPVGIDSINMIRVFNNDEARGVELLNRCLLKNNLDPNFYYYYGMLYYTICFGICKVIFLFSSEPQLSIWTIAFVLKMVSFLSFILFTVLFYRLCKIFLSKRWSWLCLLAVSTMDSFSSLGQMIHPDLTQITLVVLSFLIVFKNHNLKAVYLAQFVSGLAFGTKYNSLFSFPFIFLPYLLDQNFNYKKIAFTKNQVVTIFFIVVKGGLCFLAGWIILNPYTVINYKYFLDTMLVHSYMVSNGWSEMSSSPNPFSWLTIFWNQIPPFTLLLLSVSILLSFLIPLKKITGISPQNFNLITLFSYVVFCFLYLFFIIRLREMRYGFHFIPMLFIFFFIIWQTFVAKFKLNFILPVLLIGIVFTAFQSVKSFSHAAEKLSNPLLKSGKILSDNFNKNITIYCDFYSYIPDSFLHVNYDWAVNEKSLGQLNPDVVIINQKRSGKKVWMQPARTFIQQQWKIDSTNYPEVIKTQIDFYNFLLKENSSYKLFYEDDKLIIFSKKE